MHNVYSDEDVRFAAACCGMPLRRARAELGELGWIQLVAMAVPLVTGLLKKRKAKKAAKRADALLKQQAAAAPAPAVPDLAQQQQMQQQQMALQQRAAVMQAQAVMRSRAAASARQPVARTARPAAKKANLMVPLAIAGGALALVFVFRK
jgi:hypothetical protein